MQEFAPGPPSAFDLHLARKDLTIDYRDDSPGGDLELTHVGVAFHERLGQSVRGAVQVGGLGVRQRERPATEEVAPTGWYFGLDFDTIWPSQSRLRLNAGIAWGYSRADRSEDEGSETVLDWHAAEARAAAALRLSPGAGLRVGVAYHWLQGNERFRGDNSTSTRFDADHPVSPFVQFDFLTSATGAIRFQARAGNPRGARIAFEYSY